MGEIWSCLDGVKSSENWRKTVAQRTSTDVLTQLEAKRILGLRDFGKNLPLSCVCTFHIPNDKSHFAVEGMKSSSVKQ